MTADPEGAGGRLDAIMMSARARDAERPKSAAPTPTAAVQAAPTAPPAVGDNRGPALEGDPDVYPLRLGQRLTGTWYEADFRALLSSREFRVLDEGALCIWQMALAVSAGEDPAGTLPTDDGELAWLMRRDPAAWRDLRARGALMGWQETIAASECGSLMELRLWHPRLSRSIINSVERIRKKVEGGRRGGATGRSQWKRLRTALVKVGAEQWFLDREDLVEAVQKRLDDRGENRAPGNVRAAMLVVLERNERGQGRNVAPFRRLSGQNF